MTPIPCCLGRFPLLDDHIHPLLLFPSDVSPQSLLLCACGVSVGLPFVSLPQVCLGSQMVKLVTMHNTGDIGAKVEWAQEAFAPDLTISPATAFLSPHSESRFELTFHPTRVSRDIRYSGLRCRVEGAEDLQLSVSGECMPQPESEVATLSFDGRVREEVSKKVSLRVHASWLTAPPPCAVRAFLQLMCLLWLCALLARGQVTLIKNDSTTPWVLVPVINNDYWKASTPSVTIAPGATGEWSLLYRPLTLTATATGAGAGAGAGAAAPAAPAAGAKKGAAAPAPAKGEALRLRSHEMAAPHSRSHRAHPLHHPHPPTPVKASSPLYLGCLSPCGASAGAGAGSSTPSSAAAASEVEEAARKLDELYRRPAQHEGSLFFALPNGRALMFKLVGTATAPSVAGTITQSTPAKQNLTFTLPVSNWLKATQRFSVAWEDSLPSTSFRGAKSLDVPALGTREYKMTFYAYKQCKATTVVRFTNESSGEYLLYNVEVNVTAPGMVDVVSLEVRWWPTM